MNGAGFNILKINSHLYFLSFVLVLIVLLICAHLRVFQLLILLILAFFLLFQLFIFQLTVCAFVSAYFRKFKLLCFFQLIFANFSCFLLFFPSF